MPNKDGSGPKGQGSRSGKKCGNCKAPLAPSTQTENIPVGTQFILQAKGGIGKDHGNGCGCRGNGHGRRIHQEST